MIALRYRISALPTAAVERLRRAPFDDFGNPLEAAVESGPCRHCLRYAQPGERLVLLAYSPFERTNPYAETGPIFVHADGCARYEDAGLPPDFAARPLALRGYDAAQTIARAEVVVDGTAAERIAALLDDPQIAFVHVRSLTHGCYMFRADRD
jgi:hypothetical protein